MLYRGCCDIQNVTTVRPLPVADLAIIIDVLVPRRPAAVVSLAWAAAARAPLPALLLLSARWRTTANRDFP